MKRLINIVLLLLLSIYLSGQVVTTSVYFAPPISASPPEEGTYPAVLDDGHTVAWFISDSTANMTRDGDNLVSSWGDETANNHDLVEATTDYQPLWQATGILFNHGNQVGEGETYHNWDRLRVTFAYDQPAMVYMVIRQLSWTTDDYIMDGYNVDNLGLYQNGTTPDLKTYAGTASASNSNLALNTWGILRIKYDGANSSFQVNETSAITTNIGTNDPEGITLGRPGNVDSSYGHFEVAEIIFRDILDGSTDADAIYDYLNAKYSLGL